MLGGKARSDWHCRGKEEQAITPVAWEGPEWFLHLTIKILLLLQPVFYQVRVTMKMGGWKTID